MARIEWYAETNRKLNSPLTPANRCTDKTTALQNNADPAPLADFEPNRLVPTTAGYVKLWEHLIRFKNYDGTVLQEINVPHGTVPTYTGSTPTRTGYAFTGWSPTPVAATADADYIAQFTVNSYTITYNNNIDGQSTTRSVNYGDTAPSITPWSISGYTFDHWNKQFGTVTGDDTYTAIYTQNTVYYTVTFIVDGSTYDTQSVAAGGYASTPTAPTKSGYTFTGWSPDVASTQINGDTTFTAQFVEDVPPVVMLADVGWKTADAGGGTPHGDPSNDYETSNDWIPGGKIPIHVWFEPMYTSGGTELSYTDPIATVNGVSVSHNDLTWSASLGTSDHGYEYWDNGTYGYYRSVIIMPQQLNPEQGPTNRNWRTTVQSNSSELYWMDEFPFYLTGTYNGITVVQKTIKVVCYKHSIAAAGYTSATYKGSKQGWVKNWNL